VLCYYGLNIKTIVNKYCINKNKPELKCNGKCYLKQQLKLGKPQNNNEINKISISEIFIPVFYQNNLDFKILDLHFLENSKLIYSVNIFSKELILFEIDYPPEFIYTV